METLLQDIRYGFRTLTKAPGMALMALLAIALGIGATTFVFAVVDAVLLRSLPYRDAGRLVWMSEAHNRDPGMSFAWLNFQDYRSQNRSFEQMAAIQPRSLVLRAGSELPEQLASQVVTHEFFSTLGVSLVRGRDFTAPDDTPSSQPVCILSFSMWQRRLGADPGILGRSVTLNDRDFTVIGILPASFEFRGDAGDVLAPYGLWTNEPGMDDRQSHSGTYVVARLKSGITIEQARADLDTISQRLQQQFPATNAGNWVDARPLRDFVVRNVRPALLILMAAVACLLLIACGNVANLLLARSTARARELAVRSALGATRARLLRQLLTESLLLSACGGLLGVLLASWVTTAAASLSPDVLPRAAEIHVSGGVLGFTFALSLLTGLLFGAAPALRASSADLNDALKEASRSAIGGHQGLRSSFVVAQLALSLALLVAAGLLIRSFARVLRVDLGFNPHGVLAAIVVIPSTRYPDIPRAEAFFDQAIRNIDQIPGVTSAATITPLPLMGNEWDTSVRPEAMSKPQQGWPETDIHYVTPAYLQTMQVPLLAGRNFSAVDNQTAPLVVLVNQEFIRRMWPDRNPLGLHLRLGGRQLDGAPDDQTPLRTVVGVVQDVYQYGLDQPVVPEVYLPTTQNLRGNVVRRRDLVVRTALADPAAVAEQVRKAVAAADPDQPIANLRTMDQYLNDSLALRRLTLMLLGTFSAIAVLLATTGVYAVLSYWVLQRTREIGIRVALGASRAQVLRLVMARSLRLGLTGVAIGVATALASSRLLSRLLFGVRPTDAVTLSLVTLGLLLVVLLASYIPARRAMQVDPMTALRHE